MKKIILSLSLVTLFTVAANAQDSKGHPKKSNEVKEESTKVNDDGTPKKGTATSDKKEEAPVKKGGTRMAINEKGTSGGVQPKHKSEEKKSDGPAVQPGSGSKKD
ncbi:MAG: hypothetical protein ACXVO9_08910 [Bacteroidia bacterium]